MNNCLIIFLNAVSEFHPSPKILDAIVEIGEGFAETESLISSENYYWNFYTKGITFNFKKKQLTQISIYCENFENYIFFPFELFKNFKNNATSQEILEYFGKPLETGGDEHSKYLGYIKPWWKFKINGCSINFEFNKEKRVQSIHITKTNHNKNV